MVDFIGIERIQELVARRGAARFIEELAQEIEADFRRWAAVRQVRRAMPRTPPVGVIELMPACDGRLYSFKYVNGHPKNTAAGLLTVTAFGVLADVADRLPAAALGTHADHGAAHGGDVGARRTHLARPDSRVMALIGNGAQSEFQAIAFHHLLGIREVRLYDVDAARHRQARAQSRCACACRV